MAISDLVQINVDLLLVAISVCGIALLGFLIYFNNTSSETNRSFLLFSVLTVIWGISNYLEYRFATMQSSLWALRSHLFISVWHAYAFFRLAYVYPAEKIIFPRWFTLYLTPVVVLTSILTLTPFVFSALEHAPTAGQVTRAIPAPGIAVFMIVAFGLLAAAIAILFNKTRRTPGESRKQAIALLIGMALTACLLLVFNVILPNVFSNTSFIPLAALFILPFIGLTSYSIYRYHFLNLKVATTALLGFLVTIFTFSNILFAKDISGIIINVTAFIIVLLGSIRIVRDTLDLQLANEERSEFMSFASHEIRNPITAMRGLASLIVDGTTGEVTPDTKDAAQKILVSGHDVLNIIATFLSKAKMELGKITYDKATFDLGYAVQSIAEGYKPHAEVKGLTLDLTIDSAQKFLITGDQSKVKEVVGNLIDNSLKYTKEGGMTVSVERHGPFVRAVISDTGVGIPKETLSQLFKKFSRADAQKVNLLGTGVGLFLAKTFIEAQGGRIWAESEGKGHGSRFIVEFAAAMAP